MFRVVLLPGLARFSYGWVVFNVFLAFRGLFRVGYILGLVFTILYGLGYLGDESYFAPIFG